MSNYTFKLTTWQPLVNTAVIAAVIMALAGCQGQKAVKVAGPDLSPIWTNSAQVVAVGHSVRGTPIWMYVYGRGPNATLIFGSIHGNEWTAYSVCRNLIQDLEDRPDLYYGKCVGIIPLANPDGVEAMTRTNSHGVDLNRNFPASNWELTQRTDSFGGESAASEPETRAIIKAVEELKPTKIISLHSIGGGKHGNNFDGPGQAIAAAMASKNKYAVLPSMGYPTPGSFGTWAGIDQKIATITLELPRAAGAEECWKENREALEEAIQF